MGLVARNGTHETWRASDGRGVVLFAGILTSTHGLGHDLFSADVSDLVLLIENRRGGSVERIHRYIDGENKVFLKAYRCLVTAGLAKISEPGLTTVTETCQGTENSFTNIYQINPANGRFRSSRQWVGTTVGYLQFEHQPPPHHGADDMQEKILIPVQNAN